MENLKIFEYNDKPISFITNDDGVLMINATEMAKAFGKEVRFWISNASTLEYIDELAKSEGAKAEVEILTSASITSVANKYPSLIKVFRGGGSKGSRLQGTFLCRNLTIEFARWLNPAFAIWCDKRILEYLQFGFTASDDVLTRMQEDPNFANQMAEALKAEREKNKALAEHNSQLRTEVEANAHKVNFYDTATDLTDEYNKRKTILISKVASKFGIPVKTLNKFLIRKRVIMRVDGGYDIHSQYAESEIAYQVVKSEPVYDDYGDLVHSGIKYMEYTSKGVELIKEL
ncbi:MAG: KilA-N domain-containing protein, partial [Bacillota bacterium]